MKYSNFIGAKLKQKNAPTLSNKATRIVFNVSHLEGALKNLEIVKRLLHKDNIPEYNFLQIKYTKMLKKITGDLPPDLFYFDLCREE